MVQMISCQASRQKQGPPRSKGLPPYTKRRPVRLVRLVRQAGKSKGILTQRGGPSRASRRSLHAAQWTGKQGRQALIDDKQAREAFVDDEQVRQQDRSLLWPLDGYIYMGHVI